MIKIIKYNTNILYASFGRNLISYFTLGCFKFQILLHDQGEIPEMKDQGFAVAPGTHTLVGIKQYKV